ncbi:MAG: WYL domain-containing protein, partial [Flavobacterium sp.]
QFRTDRIQGIKKTDLKFTIEHDALETYLNKKDQPAPTIKVQILVEKKIVKYLMTERKYHGFISEKEIDGQIEMTFMSCDIESNFPRWFLMFGDYAKILEPERLKIRVLELLEINKKRLL